MKKIFCLMVIVLFVIISGCTVISEDSIVGRWHVTHIANIRVTDNEYYYWFRADKKFYRSEYKSDLEEPIDPWDIDIHDGTYTLSGVKLDCKFESGGSDFQVDAYTKDNGKIMLWYINGIEMTLESY